MTRRVKDISSDLLDQLGNNAKQFESFCLALDESNDSSDNVRLSIFIQGTTKSSDMLEFASLTFSRQNRGRTVSDCVRNEEGT
jgi:hypothetical protein